MVMGCKDGKSVELGALEEGIFGGKVALDVLVVDGLWGILQVGQVVGHFLLRNQLLLVQLDQLVLPVFVTR